MSGSNKKAVLVPVKHLDGAKQRLAPLLDEKERRQLAWIMLEGVLGAVAETALDWRRVLVTSYPPAIELGKSFGFEVLRESHQVSESRSVDEAGALLEREGAAGVLRIPLDLPLLSASALKGLLEKIMAMEADREAGTAGGPHKSALLVPSRDGTGTNAIYRAPPTLFPSSFGPGSRELHEQAALAQGVTLALLNSAEIALDIDNAEDVAELVRRAMPCPALDYLLLLGIEARLAGMSGGG